MARGDNGKYKSRNMTKPTKCVRQAKTQISLGIRPVWLESSLCAQWVAKDPSFLHADSEDSDQTGRMSRLIAGRALILLVLSWRGSKSSLPVPRWAARYGQLNDRFITACFERKRSFSTTICPGFRFKIQLEKKKKKKKKSETFCVTRSHTSICWSADCEILIHDGKAGVN